MKEKTYNKRDGSTGKELWLEPGDTILSKWNSPNKQEFPQTGKPTVIKYSILAETKDHGETYVSLTEGQYKYLKMVEGSLENAVIEAITYTNDFGEQVGVKVTKKE